MINKQTAKRTGLTKEKIQSALHNMNNGVLFQSVVEKSTRKKIVNILGQEESDPIYDFLNCYHRFSLHGHRSHQVEFNCVCNHPTNAALGVVQLNNE
jgi:hypothetical protein